MNQIVPLITAIIFMSFPLTWAELRVVDSGILPLKRGDIGMIFFVSVSNTCTKTYQVSIHMVKCCEIIHQDEPHDCDTIKLVGGNMGELKQDEIRDLTYIFPNLYPYNRKGQCEVAVCYHYQGSEPKQLKIKIPFDTMLVKTVKVPKVLKGFYNPLTLRRCTSKDEDPLDKCLPVNCHMKYSGQRSHYSHKKSRCEKVPKCIADPNAEMPDIVYVPATNECRKVSSTLSEEDMKYLSETGDTYLQDRHWKNSMMPHLKNMRCHHGHLDNKSGICVCDRGWGSLPIDPETFNPTAALYHMCTIKQPCGSNDSWYSAMDIVIAAMLFLMICASGQYYVTHLTKTRSDRNMKHGPCSALNSDDPDCHCGEYKRYVPPLKRVPSSTAMKSNAATTDGDADTDASRQEETSSAPSTAKTPDVEYDENGFLREQVPSPPGSSNTGETKTEPDLDGTASRRSSIDRDGTASRRSSIDRDGPANRRNSTEQDQNGPATRRYSTEQDRDGPANRRNSTEQNRNGPATRRSSIRYQDDPVTRKNSTEQDTNGSATRRNSTEPNQNGPATKRSSIIQYRKAPDTSGRNSIIQISRSSVSSVYMPTEEDLFLRKSSSVEAEASRSFGDLREDMSSCDGPRYYESPRYEVGTRGSRRSANKKPSAVFSSDSRISLSAKPSADNETLQAQSRLTLDASSRFCAEEEEEVEIKVDTVPLTNPEMKSKQVATQSSSPRGVNQRRTLVTRESSPRNMSSSPRQRSPAIMMGCPRQGIPMKPSFGPKEDLSARKSPRPRDEVPTTSSYSPSEIVAMRKSYSPREDISMKNRYYPSAHYPIRKSLSPKLGIPKKRAASSRDQSPRNIAGGPRSGRNDNDPERKHRK